jgi:hypothetical protein
MQHFLLLRASNKMNCRTESECFFAPARRQGQNRCRYSQSYFEDDFAPDNIAGWEISRLNAEAFFRRSNIKKRTQSCPPWRIPSLCVASTYPKSTFLSKAKNKPNSNPIYLGYLSRRSFHKGGSAAKTDFYGFIGGFSKSPQSASKFTTFLCKTNPISSAGGGLQLLLCQEDMAKSRFYGLEKTNPNEPKLGQFLTIV